MSLKLSTETKPSSLSLSNTLWGSLDSMENESEYIHPKILPTELATIWKCNRFKCNSSRMYFSH